jgi:hypothetical protein
MYFTLGLSNYSLHFLHVLFVLMSSGTQRLFTAEYTGESLHFIGVESYIRINR